VHAAGARCLDAGAQSEVIQLRLDVARERYNGGERNILSGIEIDRGGIREARALYARLPRVHGNRPDLNDVEQRCQIAANDPIGALSASGLDASRSNPIRHIVARILLKERRTADPIRVASQNKRPIPDDGK